MFNLLEFIQGKSVNLGATSTVKLNVNAQEFVPRFKSEVATLDGADLDFKTINTEIAALDERKSKCKLTLPWKGFPKKPEKGAGNTQIVLLNDDDYMIVPRQKKAKKSKLETLLEKKEKEKKEKLPVPKEEKPPKENVPVTSLIPNPPTTVKRTDIEEKRREKERKVAVEALKLVEQRRLRGPLLPTIQNYDYSEAPKPIVHLSRSPVRYSPEERIKVDRLKAAKKERIERVLKEMAEQKSLQKLQLKTAKLDAGPAKPSGKEVPKENQSVATAATRRYIPTTKEWDEQCRAKNQANCKSNAAKVKPTESTKPEDHKTTVVPRYRPPGQLLLGEKRKGNLTHSLPIPNWIPRRIPLALLPLVNRKGRIVQRYSIEQLLLLEPQPGELEKPDFNEGLRRLEIVCE